MTPHVFEQTLIYNGCPANQAAKILLQQHRRLLPLDTQFQPKIADRLLLMPLGTEERTVEVVEQRFTEGRSLLEASYHHCPDSRYYHILFDVMNVARGPKSYFVFGRNKTLRQENRTLSAADRTLIRSVLETYICVGFSIVGISGDLTPHMTMIREVVYDLSQEYRAYVAPEYQTLPSWIRPAHV